MGKVNRRMLIDSFAPNPDAAETHRIAIAAPPEVVYRTLWTADLGHSPIIKLLLALRSLPGFIAHHSLPENQAITLQTIIDSGFGLLAEDPDQELVLGVTGRFWRAAGNLSPFDRADFEKPVAAGFARAVWNFSLRDSQHDRTILATETRIICGDDSSRRKFRVYWILVRPFSGLIRQLMLRAVKHECESRG